MIQRARLLIVTMSTFALLGCEGFAPPGSERGRVVITAQSGSEVVLTKNVGTLPPSSGIALPEAGAPVDPGAEEPLPEQFPLSRNATGPVEPDIVEPAPGVGPLGEVRIPPWRVQPGETLFQTVSRFSERAGYTAQKADRFPLWVVSVEASYSGEFEDALEWLMAGFEHTHPRPVLSIHPNRIVRLGTE